MFPSVICDFLPAWKVPDLEVQHDPNSSPLVGFLCMNGTTKRHVAFFPSLPEFNRIRWCELRSRVSLLRNRGQVTEAARETFKRIRQKLLSLDSSLGVRELGVCAIVRLPMHHR